MTVPVPALRLDPHPTSGSTFPSMPTTVLDTDTGLSQVLAAPPREREARLRSLLEPMAGMYRYFPGDVDLVQVHRAGFGFPLTGSDEQCAAALTALRDADAWTRVEDALAHGVTVLQEAVPGLTVPDLTVLLVLGDPTDAYFTGPARGFSGNGSATGFLSLTVWPTQENLDRLEAAAVHELHHNLRYAPGGVVWDPATVTVGEQVVSEGLADAFARQLYGDRLGHTPIGRPHLEDDAVLARVVEGLEVTGMQHFVSWVHGDEAARRFGADPVGLPTGAGYAAGNRLVDAHLAAAGTDAAQALHVPSRVVLGAASTLLG